MSYYGRGRRRGSHPTTLARQEREREDQERAHRGRESLREYLNPFRKIEVFGDEARHAWRLPEVRSFYLGRSSDGSYIQTLVRGDEDGVLYLQEPHFPSWKFSRLVPRYHVRTSSEPERDRTRSRTRQKHTSSLRRRSPR